MMFEPPKNLNVTLRIINKALDNISYSGALKYFFKKYTFTLDKTIFMCYIKLKLK